MAPDDHNPPVTVRHISKDHVTIHATNGYSVVLFNLRDGNVEAIVVSDDGFETIRLLIAGPDPDQNMAIKTDKQTGIINFLYGKKTDVLNCPV
jgi:hypothetical protein